MVFCAVGLCHSTNYTGRHFHTLTGKEECPGCLGLNLNLHFHLIPQKNQGLSTNPPASYCLEDQGHRGVSFNLTCLLFPGSVVVSWKWIKQSYYFKENNWVFVASEELWYFKSSIYWWWRLPCIWGVVFSPQHQKSRWDLRWKFKHWESCTCLSGLRSLGLGSVFWWALWSHKWLWLLWYHLMKCANICKIYNSVNRYFPVGQVHGRHKIVHRERFLFHFWKYRPEGSVCSRRLSDILSVMWLPCFKEQILLRL